MLENSTRAIRFDGSSIEKWTGEENTSCEAKIKELTLKRSN